MSNIIPLVSVLMTSYNREDYIAEAIESLLKQTYTKFELIVVDDCSSDNTYEIIKSYSEKDTRIQCFQNEKNIGQFQNRNLAASYAKGTYIKYLDSDDILYPHSLQIYLDAMSLFPDAIAAVEAHHHSQDLKLPSLISSKDALLSHYKYGSQILYVGPSCTMLRKSMFDELGGFETERGILNDTLFMLRLAEKGSIVLVQRDLCFWRIHGNQENIGQQNIYRMLIDRQLINIAILFNPHSILDFVTRLEIWRNLQRIYFINIIKNYLIKGKIKKFYVLLKFQLRNLHFSQ